MHTPVETEGIGFRIDPHFVKWERCHLWISPITPPFPVEPQKFGWKVCHNVFNFAVQLITCGALS